MWTSSALDSTLWCGGEKERLTPVLSAYDSEKMQHTLEEDKTEKNKCAFCLSFVFCDFYEMDSEENNKGFVSIGYNRPQWTNII